LSVRLPVPETKSIIERYRKIETDDSITHLEVKKVQVNVTRPLKGVTENQQYRSIDGL